MLCVRVHSRMITAAEYEKLKILVFGIVYKVREGNA